MCLFELIHAAVLKLKYNAKLIKYLKKTEHVQNPPAIKIHPFKIHPVKLENRLPIEGKG